MTFVGASPDVDVRGVDKLQPYVNFFLGNDPKRWRSRVPTFGSVMLEGVYEGVDMELHRRQGRLEYDFILAPGVDPGVVKVRFDGALSIELDQDGVLSCQTAVGILRQSPPVAFHRLDDGTRESVECRIVQLGEAEFGFTAPMASAGRVLVIDPQVGPFGPDYFTYLGGTDSHLTEPDGMDEATDVVVNGGKAVVTGATASLDFPVTPGVVNGVGPFATDTDVFVTKLDHTGAALVWSTYLGGSNPDPGTFNDDEIGMGVARTVTGAFYVTGYTTNDDFPTTTGVFQPASSSFGDAFLCRLSTDGTSLDFATYLGGSQSDTATDVATDVDQNAYVCGYTRSVTGCNPPCSQFPTMGSVIEPTNPTSSEAGFVSKFDRTGTLLQSTFVRSPSAAPSSAVATRCWALALDPDDTDPSIVDVWLTGEVEGATSPTDDFYLTSNAFQPTFAGGTSYGDGFVLGLDPGFANVLYGSYLGGELGDVGLGIDVYPASKVVVVGRTESPGFPTTNNAHQPFHGGLADGFYMRIDPGQSVPAASLVLSSFFGSSSDDYVTDVVADATGRDLYLTGASHSPGPVALWPGAGAPATVVGIDFNHGGADTILATVTGFSLSFFVFMGGFGDDVSHAIDLDFGSVTLAGSTVFDPNTPVIHFYAVLDNLDGFPGNGVPLGFEKSPQRGDAYTPGTFTTNFLTGPGLDQPGEMDAFVLRFNTP